MDQEVDEVFASLMSEFYLNNISVEFVEEPRVAERYLQRSSKSGLSPYLDSNYGEIGAGNCFWILLFKDRRIVGSVGSRLDHIPTGGMESFWKKQQRDLKYGNIDSTRMPPVASEMSGSVVYLGDLFLEPRVHINMRALGMLSYTSIHKRWRPDWFYAFLTKRDASRKQLFNFNMPRVYEGVFKWNTTPPKGRDDSDWLVAMSSNDFLYTVGRYLGRTSELGEVHDHLGPARAVNG